mgnify:CR=1 FL=1
MSFEFEKPQEKWTTAALDERVRQIQDIIFHLHRQVEAKSYELRMLFAAWEKRVTKPPEVPPGAAAREEVEDVSILRALQDSLEPLPDE